MSYEIRTREYHEAELARIQESAANRERRIAEAEVEWSDCFVSIQANNDMQRYHKMAIYVIDAGMKAMKPVLMEGDRIVNASMREGDHGDYWMLHDSEAALIEARGKRFLPVDYRGTSRILKGLGLRQDRAMLPVKPYFKAYCAGIGFPLQLSTVAA